jgi:hypothetical protein
MNRLFITILLEKWTDAVSGRRQCVPGKNTANNMMLIMIAISGNQT